MSKLPKSDRHPQYKSTSCCLSSISSTKNSTFQCSSIYELHFTYKFIYVFVLQFYDPNLVVQFIYIKSAFDQQIKQVSTFRILSFETVSDLPRKLYSLLSSTTDSTNFKESFTINSCNCYWSQTDHTQTGVFQFIYTQLLTHLLLTHQLWRKG